WQDERGAGDYGHHRADYRAEAVIERHGRADAIVFRGAQSQGNRHAVVDQVVVREQDALGRPGGAGGVLYVGHVAGRGRVWREIAAGGEHRVPGRLAEPDDVFERNWLTVARIFKDCAIIGPRIMLAQEEGADARLLQNVAEFVRAVGGVDVDQDDTGTGGRVLQEDPLDAVAGPYAGAAAWREPESGESAG